MVQGALTELGKEDLNLTAQLLEKTFPFHESIVRNRHHRQISDIIAILLLVQSSGQAYYIERITDSLKKLTNVILPPDDHRRLMLESLWNSPLDPEGHLYLAFDAYCRALWISKIGLDNAQTYYSYNQASFPRIRLGSPHNSVGGFFGYFKGRPLNQTLPILHTIDRELSLFSTETFMIWHTAIRCLRWETRYNDMEIAARQLCARLKRIDATFDYSQDRQFNTDSMLSFYLLGISLEENEHCNLQDARVAFENAVVIRARLIPTEDMWDAGNVSSLAKLQSVLSRLGYSTPVGPDYLFTEENMHAQIGSTVPRFLGNHSSAFSSSFEHRYY